MKVGDSFMSDGDVCYSLLGKAVKFMKGGDTFMKMVK